MRLTLSLVLVLAASASAALAPALVAGLAREAWSQEGKPAEPAAEATRAVGPETGGTPARPSARGQSCLSGADMREVVAERQVMEPVAAIRAAREALPRAEIVRVNLCHREGEPLFYLITALRRDGQFVHLTVDSKSGAVASLP